DERGEHRHLALREVDHAGGPEDQHQRERQCRVDRAVGNAVDHHLQEPLHARPPTDRGSCAGPSPRRGSPKPARTVRSGRPPARTRRRRARGRAPRSARPAASRCPPRPGSARAPRTPRGRRAAPARATARPAAAAPAGTANAFNLIDGMDGLASGAALFASLVILVLSVTQTRPLMIVVALVLCGSLAGFLRYNF